MKKKCGFVRLCVSVLYIGLSASFLFAQSSSAAANKKTALRCLQLAKEYVAIQSYDAAISQIQLGLAYDASLSDLWYLLSISRQGQGASHAEVMPLVVNSLQCANWNDYNYDNARLLYARLLCDTDQFEQAVALLDEAPVLLTADAELIRIKSYYCMHTAASLEKARNRIEADGRIYLQDYRFAQLFYTFEYEEQKRHGKSEVVAKQALFFSRQLKSYKGLSNSIESELAMYDAAFTEGEEQVRKIKAFNARGCKHPLYAIIALKAAVISQSEAVSYFTSFANDTISLSLLQEFAPLITEDEAQNFFVSYLTAYDGVLTIDTDGDLAPNQKITYHRGRPASIVWDKNNDGNINLSAECDFGATQIIELGRGIISVEYDEYPNVVKVLYRNNAKDNDIFTFTMVPHEYTWEPYTMKSDAVISRSLATEFYVPVLKSVLPETTLGEILQHASHYEIASKEYEGAQISFAVLRGKIQHATYMIGERVYAKTEFKDGLPLYRIIDRNNDGIFETRETFRYDPENLLNRTAEEKSHVMLDVFGTPSNTTGIYIDTISIDNDKDSLYEYVEQYLADGGKICSWYPNRTNVWDVRYIKYPLGENGELIEDSQFYIEPHHQLVSIHSVDGDPTLVTIEIEEELIEYSVTKGETQTFYWIGEAGSAQDEQKIVDAITVAGDQGISTSVALANDVSAFAVRIGNTIYSKIIQVLQSENQQ